MAVPPYQNRELTDLPGEKWKDIPGLEGIGMVSDFGRVKRLEHETVDITDRRVRKEARIQKVKVNYYHNQFMGDRVPFLSARIQLNRTSHFISIGRMMYYCYVERFDLSDRSIYIAYKDRNGFNLRPENLVKTDLTGLQQLIMKARRKDLHFGHSPENQVLFTERGKAANSKKISQYDMQGSKLGTYQSLTAAARETGANLQAISKVVKGEACTAGGYLWHLGQARRFPAGKLRQIHAIKRERLGIPVSQYDLEGNRLHTFLNAAEAARVVGLSQGNIRDAIGDGRRLAAGYIWRTGEARQIDTIETKQALKEWRKKYTVSRYDLNGKRVDTFPSIGSAAKATGMPGENISAVASRAELTLKDYIWKYGDAPRLADHEVKAAGQFHQYKKLKEVTQYDLGGKRVATFASMTDAAKATGFSLNVIGGAANGRKMTGGGYLWRRGKGPRLISVPQTPGGFGKKLWKKVRQYTPDGKLVNVYPNIRAAARAGGVSVSSIAAVLRGERQMTAGYIWRYYGATEPFVL